MFSLIRNISGCREQKNSFALPLSEKFKTIRLSFVARRRNKYSRPFRPLNLGAAQTSSAKSDGRWVTRPVRQGTSEKSYLCPGCNQLIAAGVAHIVAWPHTPPIGSSSGLDHRRHWHKACWERKR